MADSKGAVFSGLSPRTALSNMEAGGGGLKKILAYVARGNERVNGKGMESESKWGGRGGKG